MAAQAYPLSQIQRFPCACQCSIPFRYLRGQRLVDEQRAAEIKDYLLNPLVRLQPIYCMRDFITGCFWIIDGQHRHRAHTLMCQSGQHHSIDVLFDIGDEAEANRAYGYQLLAAPQPNIDPESSVSDGEFFRQCEQYLHTFGGNLADTKQNIRRPKFCSTKIVEIYMEIIRERSLERFQLEMKRFNDNLRTMRFRESRQLGEASLSRLDESGCYFGLLKPDEYRSIFANP